MKNKIKLLCGALLVLALSGISQAQITFTGTTGAIGVHLNGTTVAGTDISEAVQLFKTVSLSEHNILAPGFNMQGYYGAGTWTPNISNLTAKTQLPPNTIQPFLEVGTGVAINSATAGHNHSSTFAGGGIYYSPTSNGNFTVTPFRIDYFNAPGFGKKPNGYVIAGQLAYTWGGSSTSTAPAPTTTSAVPSAVKK